MFILINALIFFVISDPVLHTADKFFETGNYENAITEYKRFLFFHPHSESLSSVYYQLARAYFESGNFAAAIRAAQEACRQARDERQRFAYEIKTAVLAIGGGNYSLAEAMLLRLSTENAAPDLLARAAFFRAIAGLYAYKWRTAREAFAEYFALQPDSIQAAHIDSLLFEIQRLKLKSPSTAVWLSTFLPGMGQIYAGDWRKGFNAFVLNAGFASWVGYKLGHGYWGDAYVIYSFLWQRYYFGNRYHARKIAEEFNEDRQRLAVKKILDYLDKP